MMAARTVRSSGESKTLLPGSLSLMSDTSPSPSAARTASRIRAPFAELIVDFFRAPEPEIKAAGYDYITRQPHLIKLEELNEWSRRPSGVLVVGSSKSLLSRLIKGDSIKNQATGAIRTAAGNLSNLNLTQLITLRQNCDVQELQKSAIPELRDFASCLEEAFHERLAARALESSSVFYVKDEKRGCEVEAFSNAERKFLGRRLLLNLGAIAYQQGAGHSFPFPVCDSSWFIFCGSKSPLSESEVRGFYFTYSDVKINLTRPPVPTTVYCLADLRDSDASPVSGPTAASWHILSCSPSMGIDELVRSSMSCKSLVASPQTKTSQRVMRHIDSTPANKLGSFNHSDSSTTPSTDLSSSPASINEDQIQLPTVKEITGTHQDDETTTPVSGEQEKSPLEEEHDEHDEEVVGEEAEGEDQGEDEDEDQVECEEAEEVEVEAEGEAEGEEWEYSGPVEYDEAVPTYYDLVQEQYFYYGNILYFDPDWMGYYYYDWEQENYLYIDEETQQMINDGLVPVWSEEDGQYYEASAWAAEEENDSTPHDEDEEQPNEEEEEDEDDDRSGCLEEVLREIQSKEAAAVIQEEQNLMSSSDDDDDDEGDEPAHPPLYTQTARSHSLEQEVAALREAEINVQRKDSLLLERMKPIQGGSLQRVLVKTQVPAPPKAPDRFTGSIDQFQSSEARLIQRALQEVICLFNQHLFLLEAYERRPNGTLRVGRQKRTFDGLIKGSLELKSLAATDCADAASNLALLNLAQLVYIRRNAQNSAWNKSPLSTLKTFAMKTDSLIAEKFAMYLIVRGQRGEESIQDLSTSTLPQLTAPEWRHAGSQAIFVIGAMGELKTSKVRIQGADYAEGRTSLPRSSWWYLSCSPTGTAAVPRGKVEGVPKGVFFQYPELVGTFDRPSEADVVFKLIAGRQQAGFLTWDILEINL